MSLQSAPFLKWWIWFVYLILVLIGVPWYWKADDTTILFGMPAWVLVAVLASLAVSFFTSFLWFTHWQCDEAGVEDYHE